MSHLIAGSNPHSSIVVLGALGKGGGDPQLSTHTGIRGFWVLGFGFRV